MPSSNRFALYESPESSLQSQLPPTPSFPKAHASPVAGAELPWMHEEPWGTFQGSLKDTMIHEATHQVAFNTGLHSRIGENPRWVVEGLATVFEAPGVRNSGGGNGPARTRINHERFMTFGDFSKSRFK